MPLWTGVRLSSPPYYARMSSLTEPPLLRACRALLFLLVIADAMSSSSRLAQQTLAIGFFCLLTSSVLRGIFF